MTYQEALNYLDNVQVDMKSIESVCIASGLIETCKNALEKQIPKKPLRGRCGTLCPSCHRLEYIVQRDALDTHCGFCGQALDWSDE